MKTTKHATLPLTVYYDGSCRLCATEMGHLARADGGRVLHLVDCAAADFDDSALRSEGVTRADLLGAMHVRDAQGHWFTRADAFEALYGSVGLDGLAAAWTHPLLRATNERLYGWVVRHRHQLSRLQAHRVIDLFWRWLARRLAERRAASISCADGACLTHSSSQSSTHTRPLSSSMNPSLSPSSLLNERSAS